MDWEILIPLLMFAFPVIVSLLDKRAKQKRAATPQPKPTFPPISRQPVSREPIVQKQVAHEPVPDNASKEEGVRAIHRKEEEKKVETQPADKLKIDKKKLIIYSEILKPKFDA